MTLHEAIEKLLRQTGRPMTTQQVADELNRIGWYSKKDESNITAFQILGRTRKYANLFHLEGTTIALLGQELNKKSKIEFKPILKSKRLNSSLEKDEQYVLSLCDKILGMTSRRQHKFDFLVGDPGKNGASRKLPVDSYYESLSLVIEYCERQHTESVTHFDKPNLLTISGVHRGLQRKIYDERRRRVLPQNGINLLEISYSDFKFNNQKRIIRDVQFDTEVVKKKLKDFVK